jgi:hypothetical protein
MTNNLNFTAWSNKISATLFSLAGLLWVLSGNIPIGMMHVCIGMYCFESRKITKVTK